MTNRIAVSSAEFIRNIGHWQSEALRQPISITHHGRERLILAAPAEFTGVNDHGAGLEVEALRAVRAALMENIQDGYLQFNGQVQVVAANLVAEMFLGRVREALFNQTVFELLPQVVASAWANHLQRAIRQRRVERFESRVDLTHLAVSAFPVQDGAGLLFSNITEQRRILSEHEDMAAMIGAASMHPHLAVLTLDARGRLTSVNAAFERATGFMEGDVVGHRLLDLVASARRRDFASALEHVLAGSGSEKAPLTLVGKQGVEIDGDIALSSVTTEFAARGAAGVWSLAPAARGAAADARRG